MKKTIRCRKYQPSWALPTHTQPSSQRVLSRWRIFRRLLWLLSTICNITIIALIRNNNSSSNSHKIWSPRTNMAIILTIKTRLNNNIWKASRSKCRLKSARLAPSIRLKLRPTSVRELTHWQRNWWKRLVMNRQKRLHSALKSLNRRRCAQLTRLKLDFLIRQFDCFKYNF